MILIVAVSYFNSHWSLILVDVEEEIMLFRSTFWVCTRGKSITRHTDLKKIVWHQLWIMIWTTMYDLKFLGGILVTSNTFSKCSKKPLPKQRNGYDCGLFSVMNFNYIPTRTSIDFHPGDMDSIRKWSMNILLNKPKQGFKKPCVMACFQNAKQSPWWFEVNRK